MSGFIEFLIYTGVIVTILAGLVLWLLLDFRPDLSDYYYCHGCKLKRDPAIEPETELGMCPECSQEVDSG